MDNSQLLTAGTTSRKSNSENISQATEKHFRLESFFKLCDEQKIRGEAIMKLAEEQGIKKSYATLRRLRKEYQTHGIKGLLRKEYKLKGIPKSFSDSVLHKLQEKFIDWQHVNNAYEETHKWLRTFCKFFVSDGSEYIIKGGRLYLANNNIITSVDTLFIAGSYVTEDGEEHSIGSYRSAADYVKDIRSNYKGLLHYKKFGKSSYRLKIQQPIKRDYSHLLPNDLWITDHKRLDLLLLDIESRTIFRPWLTGFLRASTREYCYIVTSNPSSETIAEAFLVAARKWGIPSEIYHDRGKDYLSNRIMSLWKHLNIKSLRAISRNARAKMIEPFHNRIDTISKALPGYTGNKYEQMPEMTKDMLKQQAKVLNLADIYDEKFKNSEYRVTLTSNLEGRLLASKKRFLLLDEFKRECDKSLAEYEEKEHDGLSKDLIGRKVKDRLCDDDLINKLGEKVNSPAGRLQYYAESGYAPVFADNEVLSLFAMDYDLRTVRVSGVSFDNEHYFSSKLKKILGQQVLIKFTKNDKSEIYIFHSDDLQTIKTRRQVTERILNEMKYVCTASLQTIFAHGDDSYLSRLHEQRAEEKDIKNTLGLHKLTPFETVITEIKAEKQALDNLSKPKKKLIDWNE